jgi:thioredoxin-like negative regulator of GroEL
MTQKEVIEFSNKGSATSTALEPLIQAAVKENPEVYYTRINYDEDPDIIKALIASQAPTISPFFVSFVDGKAVASAAGLLSAEELNKLFKF